MIQVIVFGSGNIGKVLIQRLAQEGVEVKHVINSKNVSEWQKLADECDRAFVAIPTTGTGEHAFEYARYFLEKGKPVITCEKASIAYHWNELHKYKNKFGYSASVGGGTLILRKVSEYKPNEILEIKAVVNGTLNYISDGLKNGKSKENVLREVLEKGFAEPGASTFEEVIQGEIKDVLLKTIIIANHSSLFDKTIKIEDIDFVGFQEGKSCIVKITKDFIQAGFIEDTNSEWLPDGVNNVLYINGEEKARGPGAGAEATVGAMIADISC